MSTYLKHFEKAAESEPGSWKRHLGNAALVGLGSGAGAAAGTAAVHALGGSDMLPDLVRHPYFPIGMGVAAGGIKLLLAMREAEKQRRLYER